MEEKQKTSKWEIFTLLLVCAFLMTMVFGLINILISITNMQHEQRIEELELEKEISMIRTNNISNVDDNVYSEPCFVIQETTDGYKNTEHYDFCYTIK